MPDLEALFGDPFAEANPVGFAAVLAADERGELLPEGEALLTGYGLGAEFVPTELGGRFDRADRMAAVLRAVFRRDCALGLGHGVTSFIAAAPIWTSGNAAQRNWVAEYLLGGGRLSAAYTELAHGNDFTRVETRATRTAEGFVLDGRKELVNNAARADAAVVFAKTEDRPGSRGHSHFLVDLAAVPAGSYRRLPDFPTVGVRGCLLGGFEFTGCPLPGESLVGAPGEGMETVLRAFQVTRAVLPGMTLGALDTLLRLAARFAAERRLYGRTVAGLPHAGATLAGAFTDLLICDCLCTVAARALHVVPEQAGMLAAATKYLVPRLAQDAAYALSVLFGARGYLREGPFAMAQKIIRDLPVLTFGHANAAVCQSSIIPRLPRIARTVGEPAPEVLFRSDGELPPLDFGLLTLDYRGHDRVLLLLEGLPGEVGLPGVFEAELARWRDTAVKLAPRDTIILAGRAGFETSHRYALLLAAASSVGVWLANRDRSPFLDGGAWIRAALRRLGARLGRHGGDPAEEDEELGRELFARCADGVTLDLAARPLGRSAGTSRGRGTGR
ncbi:acyl-CoA dehydrogenase [Amycolatopsis samaneae]|uniref:Acyl-CoA dehydrogenase n=1 Tax=Amycolatopsis samaneae TaxID=664691 RepID=A0ABW5GPE7_9PSEU